MNLILFLATLKGRLAVIAALVVALGAWRAWDVHSQRAIGEGRAVAKMEKAADANATKADAARRSVDGIPDDRLRDKYFRD